MVLKLLISWFFTHWISIFAQNISFRPIYHFLKALLVVEKAAVTKDLKPINGAFMIYFYKFDTF